MYADVEETGDWKEAVLQNASPIKCVQISRIHLPAQQDGRYQLQKDSAEDEAAQAAQCGPLVGSLEAFQTGVHFQIPRANESHVCEQGEQSAHKPETNTQNCQYQKTSRCDDFDEKTLGADFVIRSC
ncbi:RNA-binding protein [Trichinella spiralis]|uniref:RNA-binding protein n=1 Tax=Trichinella spiralis TaxID=6334 RepID=A0ABR3KMM2_TRISP